MKTGYYIYEPAALDLLAKYQQLHGVLIELENRLIQEAYLKLQLSAQDIEIVVIEVKYSGSYPAIGINSNDSAVVSKITAFIDDMLRSEVVNLFVMSLFNSFCTKC